ncbi:MAG: phosphoglycerate dehydrogenase [Nitrososphaeria archaeon]|nr:phosphoglycerate dehydrogenase [Nitrososphaeria archaeon]
MSRPVVLNMILGKPAELFSENFRKKYDFRQNPFGKWLNEDELVSVIKDVDAVVAASEPYTARVFDSAPKLKIVARFGVGYDNVNIPEATKHGVFVTILPGVNAETVAEHTMALIYAVARGLVDCVKSTKPETWNYVQKKYYSTHTPFELYGKTLGIVGLGAIGTKVAKLCTGLDMKILAFDPYTKPEKAKEVNAELVSLERLLKEADIVTIHCPLTSETRHLISEKELKMMKRNAILINAARGPIVDEKALYRALKEGWILAAGLDVMEKEPPEPNNPLFTLDNVIITPHVGGASLENFIRCDAIIEEQIEQALRGEVPKFALNPEAINYVKK